MRVKAAAFEWASRDQCKHKLTLSSVYVELLEVVRACSGTLRRHGSCCPRRNRSQWWHSLRDDVAWIPYLELPMDALRAQTRCEPSGPASKSVPPFWSCTRAWPLPTTFPSPNHVSLCELSSCQPHRAALLLSRLQRCFHAVWDTRRLSFLRTAILGIQGFPSHRCQRELLVILRAKVGCHKFWEFQIDGYFIYLIILRGEAREYCDIVYTSIHQDTMTEQDLLHASLLNCDYLVLSSIDLPT